MSKLVLLHCGPIYYIENYSQNYDIIDYIYSSVCYIPTTNLIYIGNLYLLFTFTTIFLNKNIEKTQLLDFYMVSKLNYAFGSQFMLMIYYSYFYDLYQY